MTRILVVDNYDSFAYNLVQYVAASVDRLEGDDAGRDPFDRVVVRRNDAIDVEGIRALDPDGIVVSPGPGTPEAAGVSMPLFAELAYPTLGVCLGHQALCAANGAPVGHAPAVVHGKASVVSHDGGPLYAGLPDPMRVGRYHSLAVERADLPASLVETAQTVAGGEEAGLVMGVRHVDRPHEGVQFHPESILTGPVDAAEDRPTLALGKRLVANFVEACSST